jgi:plasmid stability protein
MAQIIVRNLDDTVVDRLKARARTNDRSLEAEVRLILEQSAKVDTVQARQIVMERRKKLQGREFVEIDDNSNRCQRSCKVVLR